MTEPTIARTPPHLHSGPEPHRTIYGDTWRAAQRALAALPASAGEVEREALLDLACRIEVGWVFVRPILLYAQDLSAKSESDPVFQFSVETAELFRDIAGTALGWITNLHPEPSHDTDSMVTELERFATHVAVLEIASRGELDPLAAAIRRLAREVTAWCEGITATVRTLADLWDPFNPADDGELPS